MTAERTKHIEEYIAVRMIGVELKQGNIKLVKTTDLDLSEIVKMYKTSELNNAHAPNNIANVLMVDDPFLHLYIPVAITVADGITVIGTKISKIILEIYSKNVL